MNESKDAKTAVTAASNMEVAERVEALLGGMSLAEKIGQLAQIGGADCISGPKPKISSARAGLARCSGSTTQRNSTSCKR